MGRPKEFDPEIVLEAATNCFWTDGIVRTSISSLVDAMKIQRSSFYNSFSSREGILATVLERYLAQSPLRMLMDTSSDAVDRAPDLALMDLILDFAHFLTENGRGRGCLIFNGLGELKASDGQVFEIVQDHYVNLTEGLSKLLDRLATNSNNPDLMGHISLQHMLCILIGMAHYSKLDPTEQRLAKIGLDQLSGLSTHFASLIQDNARYRDQMNRDETEERLQA